MFTGIITEIGSVSAVRRAGGGVRLTVEAPRSAGELKVNDSVSISGVCQTVIGAASRSFEVEAVEETLRKTTLGGLKLSSRVNLELPVRMSDRLGGHLVLGHVDCVGSVKGVAKQESSWLLTIGFPREFFRYLVPVGSVAVDGVSLTVARLEEEEFVVSIIPHTLEMTTLPAVRTGTAVNLEFDILGKYIERLLPAGKSGAASSLDVATLRQWGYDL